MKKKLLILGLLSLSFVLASCGTKSVEDKDNGNSNTSQDTGGEGEQKPDEGGDTDPAKEYVNISIYEGTVNNKTLVEVQKVEKGSLIKENLTEPKKDGYNFIEFLYYSPQGVLIPDTVFSKLTASIDLNVFATFDKIDYNSVYNTPKETSNLSGTDYLNSGTEEQQANFYQAGYVEGKIPDFNQYKNTSAYVQVSNASQFINALVNARNDYTSEVDEITGTEGKIVRNNVRKNEANWKSAIQKGLYLKNPDGSFTKIPSDVPYDKDDTVYTADLTYYEDSNYVDVTIKQTLNNPATVHVIELTADIDLGYYNLSNYDKNSGIVSSFCGDYEDEDDGKLKEGVPFSVSSMLKENGISQITISKATNLLIYSKNGAKITHAGFKVESSDRVVFRNLVMDEIWQWEDSPSEQPDFTVGDMDVFGWAYFKISYCGYVWIDHCTFGKSYDGQIDVSNPYFYSIGTADRAPYGKPAAFDDNDFGGVHISNCIFQAGSDDPDGYLYKMMEEIEDDYQKSLADTNYVCQYLYYKTLRDVYNLTFEEILYGIAIPQKKGFLLGDSGESKKSYSHHYNLNLKVSLANNIFVDLEDRLPNVRGGIAYMYNSLVDNSRYYEYRQKIVAKGAQNISGIKSYTKIVNGKEVTIYPYKLALVSQGMIGGYEGSVIAENCMFIGINTLVKNNNTDKDDITAAQMVAGYKLLDCIWYNDKNSTDVERIINTDTNPDIIKSTVGQTSPMSTTYFNWHNDDNQKPFNPALYDVNNLTSLLYESQAVGANAHYDDLYLTTSKN